MKQTLEQRFWPKVQKSDGCWLWTGSKDARGYGRLKNPRTGATPLKAHRVSWEVHFGPIPDELWVLHSCDNPPCVNPAHLFLGTQADNMRDMVQKGRQGSLVHPERLARGDRHGSRLHPERLNPPRGERHRSAKLTWAQVAEIRRLYAAGYITQQQLADQFGVALTTINPLLRGKTWRINGQSTDDAA